MNVGDNVAIDQTITVEGVATTTQDPATPPTGQAYTKTTSSSYQDSNEVAVQLGDNVSLQGAVTATGQITSDPDSKITLNGDVTSNAGIGSVTDGRI